MRLSLAFGVWLLLCFMACGAEVIEEAPSIRSEPNELVLPWSMWREHHDVTIRITKRYGISRQNLILNTLRLVGEGAKAYHLVPVKLPVLLQNERILLLTLKKNRAFTQSPPFHFQIVVGSPNAVNASKDGFYRIHVKVEAKAASASFSCKKALDFGTVPFGKTADRDCTVSNQGALPLTIRRVENEPKPGNQQAFSLVQSSFPLMVRAGQSHRFVFRYNARQTTKEVEQDRFVFFTNLKGENSSNRHSITVTARTKTMEVKPDCRLTLSPSQLAFQGPEQQELVLENKGSTACDIESLTLQQDSTTPFVLAPKPLPQSIAAQQKVAIKVRYQPTNKRAHQATITVKLKGDKSFTVSLKGQPKGNPCALQFVPNTLDFGFALKGVRQQKSVAVRNTGWGDCQLQSVVWQNSVSEFTLKNKPTFPQTIKAGQQLTLNVVFLSSTLQQVKNDLVFRTTSTNTATLKVSGSSGIPCLGLLAPASFPETKLQCEHHQTWQLYHTGFDGCPAQISVQNIKVSQGAMFQLDKSGLSQGSWTVTEKQGLRFSIIYKAAKDSIEQGTLTIKSNAPYRPTWTTKLIAEGSQQKTFKEVFQQRKTPKIDVLFVLDDSCSMGDEQATLSSAYSSVISNLSRQRVDYQIGVVTTDADGRRFPVGCLRSNGTRIISPSTPNPSIAFQKNTRVGTWGSGRERGLRSMYHALAALRLSEKNCNQDFLRKDASLGVLFLSDEDDSSDRPLVFYKDYLQQLKGPRSSSHIKLRSFSGATTQVNCTPVKNFTRYDKLTNMLGGKVLPLCTQWELQVSTFFQELSSMWKRFGLKRSPLSSSIQVKVNGKVVPQDKDKGWTYDTTTQSIVFGQNAIPLSGSSIVVEYRTACTP